MDEDPKGKAILPGMIQEEPEDLNHLAETGPFVQLTSKDAPGSAENGVTQPQPRTVGSLHRSGKAPDHGAPRIGDMHYSHHEQLVIPSTIGRTVIEFEKCRQALKDAIKNCVKLDFSYVASAVSCILNSLRPLHTGEVNTAVGLFVEYADSKRSSHDEDEIARKTWFRRCESFLVVDDNGLVRFVSEFMPLFLRHFRIRGIDATHQTIATACLIQVDLDDDSQCRALTRSMPCLPARSSLAFSDYAEKYWREHCRSAEESCQDLSAATCVGPSTGGLGVVPDTAGKMAANADSDLDTIGMEHLTLGSHDEGDEMDWILVSDDR